MRTPGESATSSSRRRPDYTALLVADTKLRRHRGEPGIGGPQLHSRHKSRRQEVSIDPPDPALVQPAMPDELHDVSVRHGGCLMHQHVVSEKLPSPAFVAHQQLADHEVVTDDVALVQK